MRLFRWTVLLLLLSTSIVGAQVERPLSYQEVNVSDAPDRMTYPEDKMIKIMAGTTRHSRRSSPGDSRNDCGKIGITPQQLQDYQQTSTFIVNYTGFTPEAETAFQHAVDIWSRLITAEVPIEIDASFKDLGASTLGFACPTTLFLNVPGEPIPNTFYPSALADQFYGSDQEGSDIIAMFSNSFANWHYGLDGCPADDQFDFVTVVLHEIGHGLGVFGSPDVLSFPSQGLLGCYGFNLPNSTEYFPTIFDHFVENTDGDVKVTDFNPVYCWQELFDLYTGDELVFNAPNVNECNGGSPARLYDPEIFDVGSSYAHFEEDIYPEGTINALLTPFLSPGEAIHNPGCSIALLRDLGYNAHGFIKVVPTLGQWGLIILFLLLPILSLVAIKNKSRALLS